ncbi:hypothetical protein BATDEDRAFT_13322 [Batrachochytrium dendrobatidis JAM81]|uniref:NADP-dependent oxidoreductase domain-containing protein n=2 Tax=Batrachochytrium dendrobatidis TaxID=109871 RepID=F4P9F5_BATDJ|nr:uncharacterized protein BATDEDRAFT_13322 [Batrachochytrium dendrobatidis JAM81]EGF78392.1 hypothetical protein BATDEDRAFT_13322 [Batrachochytrium dendrobatidis JAM81]KAJ8330781.1 hypothetical protein O5D80_001289 [Batrachochytrium dendrobatidis]KAK5664554.1 hypothetical protein QVD99_008617 [Batrachochytrium dendrobatidis]OAJ44575.1 hypothetical protein BDEG_27789 [Batrachochytrium dendrobatidis JEL423]|eukprot:XP_006680998.1 hypothetical protein BATDEDRAFT_13322 [Batrachochytrium dendrobatidis JAM81]
MHCKTSHTFTLNNGATVSAIGFGTYGAKGEASRDAVVHAIKTGYTAIDGAWCYSNEKAVGEGIKLSGVPRSSLFITSKLWGTFHRPDRVPQAMAITLSDLDMPYVDLYLVHWPFAINPDIKFDMFNVEQVREYHSKGQFVDTTVTMKETWRAMEKLVKEGKTRAIGVSNFSISMLKDMLEYAEIKPAVNQVEVHPYLPQQELLSFCSQHGIVVTAYSPLGSHKGVGSLLSDSLVLDIAQRNGKTPAQVLLSWGVQHGTQVIPKSSTPSRIEENFECFEIPEADYKLLCDLHKTKSKRFGNFFLQFGVDVFGELSS